jgi:gramicidin S synthase 2/tyrocidine synthetase-3
LVDKDYEPSIPIGKPIANSTAYIVYGKGCLQPVGITGELWLGGDGVSRGYMNNPELTAEKFINEESIHPSPITRHPSPIYKTGDLARWLPDGNIEFIGRIDYQVKIRGYRVEPGEIETCLLKHPQIEEAVVIVKEHRGIGYLPHHDSGDKDLCAYIVPGGNVSAAVLRNYLTDYLPAYMQPAYFVLLDQIPLNPNGKIDYSRLPLPEMGEAEQKEDFIPPRDELDKKLVEIWSLVLAIQKDKISMDSDFFQLGGNSLKAAALISRLHQELHVKVPLSQVFTTPHVFGLADYIKGAEEDGFTSLEPVEKKEYYVMTSAQKRLYLLQQVEPDSTAYNIPLIIDAEEIPFQGEENGKLSEIFRQLIERHESLRTSFRLVNGEPVQQVHDNVNFEVEYYEVTQRAEVEHIIKCFIRPFDLSQSPFFRVGLVKWRSKSGVPLVLITDMHHIITDGVSCEILIRDFNALYAGEDKFPPLKLQYKDYAVWENRQERREAVRLQQVYWLEQFNDGIPLFSLPLDYPRPTVPSFAGSAEIFTLGKRETTEIKKIAGDEGATTFMVVLALCNIMLTKLSAREDIVIGTPTIRRPHVDLEQIIGVFLNTLSLRNFPEGGKTFTGFLKEVKMRTLKAFENQDYPFDELVDDLLTGRVPGRHPIFDVMLAAYTINRHSTSSDQTIEEKSLAGLKTGKNNRKPNTSKFDLAIICMDNEGEMSFTFQYSSTLFKQETIQRFTRYFKEIIAEVIENPSILLGDIIIDSRLEDAEEVMNYDDFAF